jgi:hypothetical protein
MRRPLVVALFVIAMGAALTTANADHDPDHLASGNWRMYFSDNAPGRAKTGLLHLAAVDKATYKASEDQLNYGSWASSGCGSTATQFYVGYFQRDADKGPVVGCISGGPSGLFYGVFQSSKYFFSGSQDPVEGDLAGTLGGVIVAGVFPSEPTDDVSTTFEGHFSGDGAAPEPKQKVVEYAVQVRGKPNVPGLPKLPSGLVSSRLYTYLHTDGDGGVAHATFKPGKGSLMKADETKGYVVEVDTYADGRVNRLVMGTYSGSEYDPVSHRLAIFLQVKESQDASCPAGAAAALVIVPGGGVRDTVFFLGAPWPTTVDLGFISTTLEKCRSHEYGWKQGAGVNVTVRTSEHS